MTTPPTLEQRLDAAAEAHRLLTYGKFQADAPWAELAPHVQHHYVEAIVGVCRAFAPEHFKDTA